MHVINLKIECKTATGDGTKIVCMNSDYRVRVTAKDCGTFKDAPIKKLVVRYDREYEEVALTEVAIEDVEAPEEGVTYYDAVLPPVERTDYVQLGVCGKDNDDINEVPKYTSTAARFACDKSVMCGVVAARRDPVLTSQDIVSNGTHKASDYNVDGFFEVNVQVPSPHTETRSEALNMIGGDQQILPTSHDVVMSKVIVQKPTTLAPDNIKKGVNIGGVTGTYDLPPMTEQEILVDGEYTPPSGYGGFSKVVVKVGQCNFDKKMYVGETFTYTYDSDARVVLDGDKSIISYKFIGDGITFTAEATGTCGVKITDFDEDGGIKTTIYYSITIEVDTNSALPLEASSGAMMNTYLEAGTVGAVIKYTGPTTQGFVSGALYVVEEED